MFWLRAKQQPIFDDYGLDLVETRPSRFSGNARATAPSIAPAISPADPRSQVFLIKGLRGKIRSRKISWRVPSKVSGKTKSSIARKVEKFCQKEVVSIRPKVQKCSRKVNLPQKNSRPQVPVQVLRENFTTRKSRSPQGVLQKVARPTRWVSHWLTTSPGG